MSKATYPLKPPLSVKRAGGATGAGLRIDRDLAEGLDDLKHGRTHGPYATRSPRWSRAPEGERKNVTGETTLYPVNLRKAQRVRYWPVAR